MKKILGKVVFPFRKEGTLLSIRPPPTPTFRAHEEVMILLRGGHVNHDTPPPKNAKNT